MAGYPVHQTAMPGENLGAGVQPCTTRARYPVHRSMKSGGDPGIGVKPAAIHGQSADLAASSRHSQTDCDYDHPPPFTLLTRSSR